MRRGLGGPPREAPDTAPDTRKALM